jgi:uncharacterized protein with von Willebrand factor type A (vWA) domain
MTVVRPSEFEVYDEAFDLFFGAGLVEGRRDGDDMTVSPAQVPHHGSLPSLVASADGRGDDDAAPVAARVGGSHEERLATRDFGSLTSQERQEVRRLIAAMIWRPATAPSRRWSASKRGGRPDLRRTFRSLVRPDGDLMRLSYAARTPRRRPLVVLADISGSMERYAEMFLHFIHAAQGRLGRVEAFVFATRLTRITREMRFRDPRAALEQVTRHVHDWSGGTRIGEAFGVFNRDWSRRVTRGGAIGLVISDGWDTGDPDLLSAEMARFARSMHSVIWLNPLASRPGYAPETIGMRRVLPHIDHLLAASNILDLREVVRLLESVPPTRRGAARQ